MAKGRRMLSLAFAVIVLLLFCPSSAARANAKLSITETFADYQAIPGVTQAEIQAIERTKALRDHLTFGVLPSTHAFPMVDGRLGGMYPLLCEHLSQLFGITFRTEVYGVETLVSELEMGNVHCTDLLVENPVSLGNAVTMITDVQRITMLYGKQGDALAGRVHNSASTQRIAFLQHSATYQELNNPTIEPLLVANYQEALEALTNGEANAFCDYEDTARVFFDAYADIIGTPYLPLSLQPVTLTTFQTDLASFLSVLKKYAPYLDMQQFQTAGQEEYSQNLLLQSLSTDEMEYIAAQKNKSVPFVASYDNYPICFYDETMQAYQGISMEVLDRVSKLTGLTFSPSNDRGEIWSNLFSQLDSGQTAFASELMHTAERSKKFIWAEPYSYDSYALISLVNCEDITLDKIPYYRVGVIKETGYTNDFDDWFPNHPGRTEFTTYAKAFDALAAGEIDCVMGTTNLLLNNANYREKTGFRANLIFDYEYASAFGFHPSQEILRSIVAKAQHFIDMEDIAKRWSLRVYDYQGKLEQEQFRSNMNLLSIVSLLMVALVSLLMYTFVRQKQMTEELNRELEETVRSRTEELVMQTEAANEASKAKSDFLARMSHEIRTPLNAIIGFSRIAQQTLDKGSKADQAIDDALSASMHLLGILNDVLNMTEIEAGVFVLAAETFALREAMEEVVAIVTLSCEDKGLAFVHNMDSLLPVTVEADKMRLKQVLISLLGNAVKFTPVGGNVRFQINCTPSWEQQTLYTEFIVSDDGIGISESQLDRIYFAFEQANTSIATQYGGAGLGLSISQKLVSMMGGAITVQSALDIGSTFKFGLTLPLVEVLPDVLVERENASVPYLGGKRVLIAEDVDINRFILEEYLLDTQISVDMAEDGLVALRTFEQSPLGYYDIILMDIQMPNMNGFEAAQSIRALDRDDAKTVVIVAVTANAYQDDINHSIASGMNRHLAKPIDLLQLMTTLSDLLLV